MDYPSVWVIIPAYNEAMVLPEVLKELLDCNPSYNIVVVDDGSADDTFDVAARYPVHLLRHLINLGQGAALATGIEYALKEKADVVVTFDADGQMSPQDIGTLVDKVVKENFDAALGSRFLTGTPEGITKLKKKLLKLATIITRLTTGLNLTDTHNGIRAFKAQAMKKVTITQNQMAHASEILSKIAHNKLTYCEVPVTIRYTQYSKAKGQSILNSINILFELFTGGSK